MVDIFTAFLVKMPPLYAILIISAFASLVITVAYKFLTDQKRMKELKDKLKESQQKMKEYQKKNNMKKLLQ